VTPFDPNDARPLYVKLASSLRDEILAGTFGPGEKLPSHAQLVERYSVARLTLQQSLRILRDEGLIVSRQGSGVFVVDRAARPADLDTHFDIAFANTDVVIDFAGYTAEPLNAALRKPLEKIRSGQIAPETLLFRVLLADFSRPLAVPARTRTQEVDDADVREHSALLSEAQTVELTGSVKALRDLDLVRQASVEIRVHGAAPLVMMYLLHGQDLFLGLNRVVDRKVKIGRKTAKIHEPWMDNAALVNHAADADPNSAGSRQVTNAAEWFESLWNTLGRPHVPA
jgi:DNA-binding transcriptional regulator YhcF (GntR family)